MKKILLFALLGLLAVSCSNNDEPTFMEQDIIGTWEAENIKGLTNPSDMPKYIRFEANSYYSSNTESTPTSNVKSYTMSYDSEKKGQLVLDIGDGKKYFVVIIGDALDLRYLVAPADPDNNVAEKWQSQPYKRGN